MLFCVVSCLSALKVNYLSHHVIYILLAFPFVVALSACDISSLIEKERHFVNELSSTSITGIQKDHEPILALQAVPGLNPEWVSLGRQLFNDKRLSADNSVACSSCHDLSNGGADSRALSIGVNGVLGEINAPTVFNSVYNFRQFWDGRAASLEEQVDGPINNPIEMGSNWPDVIAKISADKSYTKQFEQYFDGAITAENISLSIAEFERSLVTTNSEFDRYLQGDKSAISDSALAGYQRFKDLGCISCHQGVNVGGNMYQQFGVMGDYFADRGNITKADFGRFNVTGKERDRYRFKVPSLRNIALTAPYFHDGKTDTLEDAIKIMGLYQLGVELNAHEIGQLTDFLRSLTMDVRKKH